MIATIAFILVIFLLIYEVCVLFKRFFLPIHLWLLPIIFGLLITEIILRSIEIRFIALTNTYEALLFFSGIISLVLFIMSFVKKEEVSSFVLFLGTIIIFLFLALASSPIASKGIKPPVPALRSGWLILHVATTFIGESFFAFSFAAGIFYLASKDEIKKKTTGRLILTSISIGYPIFTIGALIFGAIWAQYAWGSFWSWDPKENFTLITWLVYTVYLHLRLMTKTPEKITVLVALIGFGLTLFTFFGVNYLLPGQHSYL